MKKVDLMGYVRECDDCGDPWGVTFALNQGICTDVLCFACILELAQ